MLDTIVNYVFMFFFFSAVGWTVECTYRSLGEKRVINSGFNHGPLCPIYGTGMLVLNVCLMPLSQPAEKRFWLVILLGMVLADTVEYLTSYLMEKLFHARWWDYSNNFMNLHGRICLKHTIYWGVFSVIYVYVIAPLYDFVIGFIPQNVRSWAVVVILIVFSVDLFLTVKAAIDIQNVMMKLEKLKQSALALPETIRGTADMFNEWKTDTSEKYAEVRRQFDKLTDGERKEAYAKDTKRLLLMNSGLYKSVNKRMTELERIYEELKAKYKDDSYMGE
jgi:uncharacterized membrane protein